jgi:hypothetical protein
MELSRFRSSGPRGQFQRISMAAKGPPPRRVLLTNDDGPPSPTESPFIAPFAAAVEAELGWPVQYVGTGQQSRRSVSALPRTTDGRGGGAGTVPGSRSRRPTAAGLARRTCRGRRWNGPSWQWACTRGRYLQRRPPAASTSPSFTCRTPTPTAPWTSSCPGRTSVATRAGAAALTHKERCACGLTIGGDELSLQ